MGRKADSKSVRSPEARRAETALISPIRAGAVFKMDRKPRSVPEVNKSNTGSFFLRPEKRIKTITKGMINSENERRKFMEPHSVFYNICKKEKIILWIIVQNIKSVL